MKAFRDMFDCRFRIDEPGGAEAVIDTTEGSFGIGEFTMDEFKKAVSASMRSKENLLVKNAKRLNYHLEDIY